MDPNRNPIEELVKNKLRELNAKSLTTANHHEIKRIISWYMDYLRMLDICGDESTSEVLYQSIMQFFQHHSTIKRVAKEFPDLDVENYKLPGE